jgi:hypothetical protein
MEMFFWIRPFKKKKKKKKRQQLSYNNVLWQWIWTTMSNFTGGNIAYNSKSMLYASSFNYSPQQSIERVDAESQSQTSHLLSAHKFQLRGLQSFKQITKPIFYVSATCRNDAPWSSHTQDCLWKEALRRFLQIAAVIRRFFEGKGEP